MNLDEIEARCKAATRGPWKLKAYKGLKYGGQMVTSRYGCLWHPDLGRVNFEADGDFIAHAREDVPVLVARVRELEAALERQSA